MLIMVLWGEKKRRKKDAARKGLDLYWAEVVWLRYMPDRTYLRSIPGRNICDHLSGICQI